jgi:hypothetical protein
LSASADGRPAASQPTLGRTAPRFLDRPRREICGWRRRRRDWEISLGPVGFRKGLGEVPEKGFGAPIFFQRILCLSEFLWACGFRECVWVCVVCLFVFGRRERNPMQNCDFHRSDVSSLSPVTVDSISGFDCHVLFSFSFFILF